MFNRRSLYALNKKDPDAIVYLDVDGNLVRLVRADFASDEDFQRWKAWSDADLHLEEKDGHVFSNHVRSINGLHEATAVIPSPETMLQDEHDRHERKQFHAALMEGLDDCLTSTQRRRLWLHYVEGLSLREIAACEDVVFTKIHSSIRRAKEKLRIFLKKQGYKTPF